MLSHFPRNAGSRSVFSHHVSQCCFEMCYCVLRFSSDLTALSQIPSLPFPDGLPPPPSMFCSWSSSVAQSSHLRYLHFLILSQGTATGLTHHESCSPCTPIFTAPRMPFPCSCCIFLPPLHHSFPCASHSASLSVVLNKWAVSFYLLLP